MTFRKVVLFLVAILCVSGWQYHLNQLNANNSHKVEPTITLQNDSTRVSMEHWVDSIMQILSPEERLGQLIIPIVNTNNTTAQKNTIRRYLTQFHVGGLLFTQGKLRAQAHLTNYAQQHSKVPLWVTLDGEWGLNMRLKDAPRFPRNMSLGCINDTINTSDGNLFRDSLLYAYGREIARECSVMNIQINFAPVLDINSNPNNPVIGTRSFGETPHQISSCVIPYARGLEAGGVIAVGKHFPGHGDTDKDSHKELPLLSHDTERLKNFEIEPFRQFIEKGLGGMMVAHLYIPALDNTPQLPSSLSRPIISGLLQDTLGFCGLTFTDGLAMQGVCDVSDLGTKALLAGVDVLLDPVPIEKQWKSLIHDLQSGKLPQTLIDEKCRKVLRYKYMTGLSRLTPIDIKDLEQKISSPQAKQLAKELYDASIVVAKNDTSVHGNSPKLPFVKLDKTPFVLINIGQNAINTFSRKVASYAPVERYSTSMHSSSAELNALASKAAATNRLIIAIYDAKPSSLSQTKQLCKAAGSDYTLCFFTNDYNLLKYKEEINNASAVVLAHEDCVDSNKAAAEALFGGISVSGKLCITLPELFSAGTGHSYPRIRLSDAVPEKVGMNTQTLERIDSVVYEALSEKAFPGCQVLVARNGYVIYHKAFGHHDYSHRQKVTEESIYDLASVSKAAATVPALMMAYDDKNLRLSDKISAYLSPLKGTDKSSLTIREALFHETGMRDSYPFYQIAIDSASIAGSRLYSLRPDAVFSLRQDQKLWFNKNFSYDPLFVCHEPDSVHTIQVADHFFLHSSFPDSILKTIIDLPLKRRGKYRYSCLNFCLLRRLIERVTRQSLDVYLSDRLFSPLGASSLCYNPLCSLPSYYHPLIVPTEHDAAIRKQLLHGYVHDEIAAFNGGVEGNAGLFGSAQDLVKVLQVMLDEGTYSGQRYISRQTCRLFTGTKSSRSRRGLGFDKPDIKDPEKSPTTRECPQSVYGHTGYTGTCFWIDPDNQLIYIFLSNRVHPHRWNKVLMEKNYRTEIQSIIYQAIKNNKS